MAVKAIRQIRIEGNIAYIPLTKGYEAVIDAADVPLVNSFHWFVLTQNSGRIYAGRNVKVSVNRWTIERLHHVLFGASDNMDVDHIDGNGLNNCRSNLRFATRSQNLGNSRPHKDGTCGTKGIHVHSNGSFRAQICVNGKRIHLGLFKDREAAGKAYADAALKHFGEFARTA